MKHLIDSHVHLDLIHKAHPHRIQWLCDHGCTVISWAFGQEIGSARDLQVYLTRQQETVNRIHRQAGLVCYFLSGIHPRNIPPDLRPEDVGRLLAPCMDDPRCLGIGEIGLEHASKQEQEIFCAQLELARSLKGRHPCIGIHTPRGNKSAVTVRTLDILRNFEDLKNQVVVDHCAPETLRSVLEAGYAAGITLSPIKTALADLIQMAASYPNALDRIMCNTDSGTQFNEDLIRAAGAGGLAEKVKAAVLHDAAAAFFGIEPPVHQLPLP